MHMLLHMLPFGSAVLKLPMHGHVHVVLLFLVFLCWSVVFMNGDVPGANVVSVLTVANLWVCTQSAAEEPVESSWTGEDGKNCLPGFVAKRML